MPFLESLFGNGIGLLKSVVLLFMGGFITWIFNAFKFQKEERHKEIRKTYKEILDGVDCFIENYSNDPTKGKKEFMKKYTNTLWLYGSVRTIRTVNKFLDSFILLCNAENNNEVVDEANKKCKDSFGKVLLSMRKDIGLEKWCEENELKSDDFRTIKIT